MSDRGPTNGTPEIVLQEPNAEFYGDEQVASMRAGIGKGTTTVLTTGDCKATCAALERREVNITIHPEDVP
jgi:hypothetical protein